MNYTSIPMHNASNTRLMLLEVIVPLLIEPLLIPCTDSPKTAHIAWQPSSAILTCFSSLFLWPLASAGNFSIEQSPLCLAAALLNPQKNKKTNKQHIQPADEKSVMDVKPKRQFLSSQ